MYAIDPPAVSLSGDDDEDDRKEISERSLTVEEAMATAGTTDFIF